ncbi:cyclic peptide export ABC transporter [Ascidiimonas sp. W6]|uniref:cyclic peptide export ABC transporter n=1 Tax=Ascidiimonas meishanensis TaxID=3128903 RepID=UPI0030EE1155
MRLIKIIGWVLTLFCTFFGSHELASQTLKEASFEEIREMVTKLMDEGDIPGLTLSIVQSEKDTILNFGYANTELLQKVTSQTLFELSSNSKAFTALAISELILQGKIDPELYVSDYIPWFQTTYNGANTKIKVKHIIHHTSGIPWETISDIPESNEKNALKLTVETLKNIELSHEPGKKFEYATINYDVLALIIQEVTSVPFEVYMQRIFNKLQLDDTTIGTPKDGQLKATGHKVSFFNARPYKAPVYKGNNAAGYVISSADNMVKWLKLQLGVTKTDFQKAIELTHLRDKTVPLHNMSSYAKGWEISLRGNGEIYHSGLNPNFTSHIILRPNDSLGIAVLANSNSSYTPLIADRVTKLLLGEKINEKFKPGDQNDGLFSMLSIAFSIYTLLVIAYIVFIVVQILKKKRVYEKLSLRMTGKFIGLLIMLSPFLLAIYLSPEAIADFNWNAILVWTPASFEVLIKLSLLSMAVSYVAYLIGTLFPEQNFYKKRIPQIVLFSILSGVANVLVIIMVTSALDTTLEVFYLVFYFLLIAAVYLLGRRFVQSELVKINQKLMYDIRVKLIHKIMQTSFQKLEEIPKERIYTVLNEDVTLMGGATGTFVNLVTSVITILGAFVYMFSISTWSTLIIIVTMVCLAYLYHYVGQKANVYFESARDERNTFMNLVNGMVDGMKEINLHKIKKHQYVEDMSNSAYVFKDKNTTADIKFVNAFLVGESLLLLLLGLVSIGLSRIYPDTSFFTLMSFVIVLLYLIGPINSVLNAVPHLMRLKVSWLRIQKFLKDIPADIANSKLEEHSIPNSVVQSLKMEDINFNYSDTNRGNKRSFGVGPINLEITKGEVLFITGGNGSGKTTLAKILIGLYKPDTGLIKINDEIITGSELGECFSVTFNPLYLFKKIYGISLEDRKEEIQRLIETLQLQDKVEIKNNEFSTINLSSGQRKRLGLLKCYLEDRPIYLFDEWAADQDPEFRLFFYRELIPQMKAAGKIIIAITHDNHYFDVADKILELREGKMNLLPKNSQVLS